MKSVYSYTKDELVTYFEEMGEKKFKADQLFDWLYKKRVTDFSSMINLNKKVIAKLETDMYIDNLEILKNMGASFVSLGKRILRTETAGIVMSGNIMYELED